MENPVYKIPVRKINCTEIKKGSNKDCGAFLGYIALDVPHTEFKYCRNCDPPKLFQYTFRGEGVIEKDIIGKNVIFNENNTIFIVEPIHGIHTIKPVKKERNT